MVVALTNRGRYSLTHRATRAAQSALLTAQLFCLSFLLCPSLDDDDDDDALNQRMRHRLIGTCDASPSPDFPISSGLEWLGKEHRSHSFTSGFTAVFFFFFLSHSDIKGFRCDSSDVIHLQMFILTVPFQQLSRRSDLLPIRLRAEAWRELPTTVWPWWSETSHQTVWQEAGAPTPRCWPQLGGSIKPSRNLLWGASPACRDLAINPSSRSSSGNETSEHKTSDVRCTCWKNTTTDCIYERAFNFEVSYVNTTVLIGSPSNVSDLVRVCVQLWENTFSTSLIWNFALFLLCYQGNKQKRN